MFCVRSVRNEVSACRPPAELIDHDGIPPDTLRERLEILEKHGI